MDFLKRLLVAMYDRQVITLWKSVVVIMFGIRQTKILFNSFIVRVIK